jgi:3-oxoacyl-[acyl-carrier protein] reductase
MFRLDGRTALVTGASQGIGRAVALLLARQGARVIVAARNQAKLDELVGEIAGAGGQAHPLPLDLAKPAEVPAQLARLEGLAAEWTAVDVLVNNAGVTADGLLARMTLEQWDQVLTTNLTGAFVLTRELVKGMMRRRWGRIVAVSSVVGQMGNAGQANYAASKAGMIGFTKSLAKELGSRNVTVNVVAPGLIVTAMTEALPERARQELEQVIALRRLGTVEDVAAAVLYLCSEEASYVTGAVLNVNGGMYM